MTLSAFIDTNVPFYATGTAHPLKAPCAEIILLIDEFPDTFITDAEVLQEILHRYLAIRRWAEGKAMFTQFANLMRDRVEPILGQDVELEGNLVDEVPNAGARDLIHLAVMRRLGVTRIVSADRGFDGVKGIERLDPMRIEEWRASVTA